MGTNGNSRILIVDDDESTCRTLALIFGKKGYETETAGTGREALEKAQGRFFNVTLVDIRLPDAEGVELLAPLKGIHPDMALIIVTGHASLKSAVAAVNDGATGYITKPLDMDKVLAKIRAVLEKQHLVIENRRLYQAVRRELAERRRIEEEREKLVSELQATLIEVKALSGLLHICASCKKIRDDQGYWQPVEVYIRSHSEAEFTHSLCPDCIKKLYPDYCDRV